MRIPFKTETDAFRVAGALGLLTGIAVIVGALSSRAYGVVVFAAGIAAGLTFELAGREAARGSALAEAARGVHAHGSAGGERHVLVIAGVPLSGESLAAQLTGSATAGVRLDVLAPIEASRSHHLASDVDRERAAAQARLDASLAWAEAHGFAARGEVGDSDPFLALEDELRDFGADEVVVVTQHDERTGWLAGRMLDHLARELDVPVRQVVAANAAIASFWRSPRPRSSASAASSGSPPTAGPRPRSGRSRRRRPSRARPSIRT